MRLALVPLLLPFAGGLLAALPRLAGRVPAVVAALALAAALVLVPVLPAAQRAEDFDERDFNLAGQWIDAGDDVAGAEVLLRALAARHPKSARVARRVAELDYRRARERIAAASTEAELLEIQADVEALLARLLAIMERSNPRERFRAAVLAGVVLQEQGQWGPAAGLFRTALEFDPDDRDVRRRLAVVTAEEAMTRTSVEERRAKLLAAETLLVELIEEEPTDALVSLLAQVRGQL